MTNNVKDGPSSSAYMFGPQVAYMPGEIAGVGINFNRTTVNQNNNQENVTKMTGWTIEPFFRYYFARTGDFSFLEMLRSVLVAEIRLCLKRIMRTLSLHIVISA